MNHYLWCKKSCYKFKDNDADYNEGASNKGHPTMVIWYPPIIPRLKKFFDNENDANNIK